MDKDCEHHTQLRIDAVFWCANCGAIQARMKFGERVWLQPGTVVLSPELSHLVEDTPPGGEL